MLGNSIEEAMYKECLLTIDDEVDYFIGEIKEYLDVISKGSADVLFSIYAYGEELLSKEQVEKLLMLGKNMLDEELIEHLKYLRLFKRHNVDEKEYISFANDLINVCTQAIKENKTIISIGD
ncbi:hypothetical protein [Terrisporobacter glycolicus]|nr:hypothetical protein [Terrisporobacter glycolicus]